MKAVIYARYSSAGQTEQSIEGQLRDNYDYARREGYTVIGEYIDRARTGRNDDRDNFQQMIRDSEKHQFSVIIVWKMDRFARNRYDSAIYKSRLRKNGVRIVSCKESITDGPEGIILEGMLEAMAEYYSANLSVNVKRGQRETAAKGRFCGGTIPYGYKSVEGHLVKDERTAPIIKYVFEEYAKGTPKRDIINALTDRGIKSPNGKELTLSSFQHALKSSVYCGELSWNGTTITDCAEPIISRETYDIVQKRLAKNKHAAAAAQANEPYFLQGKIYCGHCGSAMVGESGRSSNGSVYSYYACSKKKKHHSCDKNNVRKNYIESYVIDQTVNYVLNPENIKEISVSVCKQYAVDFSQTKINELQHAIDRIDKDINTLIDTLLEVPKSARQRIYDKMQDLESQKNDIEQDLSKLRIAASVSLTPDKVEAWLRSFVEDTSSITPERSQKLIDTFINSVYLFNDHIEIYYNTTNSPTPPHHKQKGEESTQKGGESSDTNVNGTPFRDMSELMWIFGSNTFGISIPIIKG